MLMPRVSLPWNTGGENAPRGDDAAERQEEHTRAKPGFSLSASGILGGASSDRLVLSRKITSCGNCLIVQLSDYSRATLVCRQNAIERGRGFALYWAVTHDRSLRQPAFQSGARRSIPSVGMSRDASMTCSTTTGALVHTRRLLWTRRT